MSNTQVAMRLTPNAEHWEKLGFKNRTEFVNYSVEQQLLRMITPEHAAGQVHELVRDQIKYLKLGNEEVYAGKEEIIKILAFMEQILLRFEPYKESEVNYEQDNEGKTYFKYRVEKDSDIDDIYNFITQ